MNTSQTLAVVCAGGIGDALITSIAAHHLRQNGYTVTVFSPHLKHFGKYLEEGEYLDYPTDWKKTLASFDKILLQHDETPRAKEILSYRNSLPPLYVIYTNYRLSKHGPLIEGFDYPVDEKKTMVENIVLAMDRLFSLKATTQNCIKPISDLSHRKHKRKILIHPTSTKEEKNWLKQRFLKLAKRLDKLGFEPVFILSPEERKQWPKEIPAPNLPNLEHLATEIYESSFFIGNDSGPAHLASYFSIPLIVICQGRQMPLWSPGWHPPRILSPPRWIPNMKGMRLRENKWKYWITTNQVCAALLESLSQNYRNDP